jgi:hypothetical protein
VRRAKRDRLGGKGGGLPASPPRGLGGRGGGTGGSSF